MSRTISPAEAERLRDDLEAMRERCRQLEAILAPHRGLPRAWRLTTLQEHLVLAIAAARGEVCLKERLWTVFYGMRDEPPISNIFNVHISQIRRKLERVGVDVRIETVRGRGFRIPREGIAILDATLGTDVVLDTARAA